MPTLHRHQLVRLGHEGWRGVCERPWEADVQACLVHWAEHRLPLVVTQQAADVVATGEIALGLAAPLCWQRRRIALRVKRHHITAFEQFPGIEEFALGSAWQRLCVSLASLGTTACVHGSHGWQKLSGLAYVHARSDVDLWVAVADATHADAVAVVLDAFNDTQGPRLDGELLLPDGRAFAWREWQAWRTGRTRAILAKTLTGASLVGSKASAATQPC